MSRHSLDKTYHERVAESSARQAQKNSATHRERHLNLKKVMREYSRETGHTFPADINKLIGLK